MAEAILDSRIMYPQPWAHTHLTTKQPLSPPVLRHPAGLKARVDASQHTQHTLAMDCPYLNAPADSSADPTGTHLARTHPDPMLSREFGSYSSLQRSAPGTHPHSLTSVPAEAPTPATQHLSQPLVPPHVRFERGRPGPPPGAIDRAQTGSVWYTAGQEPPPVTQFDALPQAPVAWLLPDVVCPSTYTSPIDVDVVFGMQRPSFPSPTLLGSYLTDSDTSSLLDFDTLEPVHPTHMGGRHPAASATLGQPNRPTHSSGGLHQASQPRAHPQAPPPSIRPPVSSGMHFPNPSRSALVRPVREEPAPAHGGCGFLPSYARASHPPAPVPHHDTTWSHGPMPLPVTRGGRQVGQSHKPRMARHSGAKGGGGG